MTLQSSLEVMNSDVDLFQYYRTGSFMMTLVIKQTKKDNTTFQCVFPLRDFYCLPSTWHIVSAQGTLAKS